MVFVLVSQIPSQTKEKYMNKIYSFLHSLNQYLEPRTIYIYIIKHGSKYIYIIKHDMYIYIYIYIS